jgi:1-acyl-sn-glycerol-3-phosphate acyltransferase
VTIDPGADLPLTDSPHADSPHAESPHAESPHAESPHAESPHTDSPYADLPHTDQLSTPGTWAFRLAQPLVGVALRTYWRVQVHDLMYLPTDGPVVLAVNHLGVLDGPLLAAVTPRTSFALVKTEMYDGPLGWVLTQFGQIPIDRHAVDPSAIRRSVKVLRDGGVLAVFPEGVRGVGDVRRAKGGAVYLAIVTGAPIVPVALLGTREPGRSTDDLPKHGAPVHVVYGPPLTVPHLAWPRPRTLVAEHTERLRSALADHVVGAQRRTGLTLPGPPAPKATRKPKTTSPSEHSRAT